MNLSTENILKEYSLFLVDRGKGSAYPTGCVSVCDVGVLWREACTNRVGFWREGYHSGRTATVYCIWWSSSTRGKKDLSRRWGCWTWKIFDSSYETVGYLSTVVEPLLLIVGSCWSIVSESNVALQEFLRSHNPNQQHSETLESFLIKPIQRILKYPLLLRQLTELTDPSSSEHAHLRGSSCLPTMHRHCDAGRVQQRA